MAERGSSSRDEEISHHSLSHLSPTTEEGPSGLGLSGVAPRMEREFDSSADEMSRLMGHEEAPSVEPRMERGSYSRDEGMSLLSPMTEEGPPGEPDVPLQARAPCRRSTLCVRGEGCERFSCKQAYIKDIFWFLGSAYPKVQVPLHSIDDEYSRSISGDFKSLFLEFSSCSQLQPFISSLTTLLRSPLFESIFLVSHSPCAPGSCLLHTILNILGWRKSLNRLTIWGTHLSNQLLRVTFQVTYAFSYIETHSAGDDTHPPLHDLSLLEALSTLHFTLSPQATYASHLSLCDVQLHSLDLVSLNLTDREVMPGAIHAWLTSDVPRALHLQSIVLSNSKIDDTGASLIISALRLSENSSLRILDLSHNKIQSDGFVLLAAALADNTALSHLYVGSNPIQCQPWATLIKVLGKTNRTLEKLQVDGCSAEEAGASIQDLCELIRTNTTLKHLEICAFSCFLQSDVVAIFKALEENKALASFALPGCNAVAGDDVYEAILDSLLRNDSLESLNLSDTPISQNCKQHLAISRLLKRHDDDRNEQPSYLQHLPKVPPNTSRVFLCGEGLAGKTTICRTMARVLKSRHQRYFNEGSDAWREKLMGLSRTKGIEVTRFEHSKIHVSLWDLAGQSEYHAFHDLMLPLELGPSLFLIVCSLMASNGQDAKSDVDIKREIEYWLRYISSNTRKLKNEDKLPNVILIFSHKDKLPTNIYITGLVQNLASQFREEYKDFTRVLDAEFIINACNKEEVKGVADYVFNVCGGLLAQCPPTYDLCNKARRWIDTWNSKHPDEPWLQTSEFFRLAKHELRELIDTYPQLVSKRGLKDLINAVCYSLHDSGHVIFFKEVSIVFLNPGWFGKKFMGVIIDGARQLLDSIHHLREEDAWERKDVEKMMEFAWKGSKKGLSRALEKQTSKELSSFDLIQILLKLDFCYELDPGKPDSSLLIPSALPYSGQDSGLLKWDSTLIRKLEITFHGRRLKCEDEKHTFLTPGFFPALQAHLRKSFPSPAVYSAKRNVIKIHVDRMEILIEFCEKPITFIDILARSGKSSGQTIEFLREHLIESIKSFQSVTGHWQGVVLVEGIVRPACVRNLTPCLKRLDQFVLVKDLRTILLKAASDVEDVSFPWPASDDPKFGVEHSSIKELLGDEYFSQVLGNVWTQIARNVRKELDLSVSPINSSTRLRRSNSEGKPMYCLAASESGKALASQIHSSMTELLITTRDSKLPRFLVPMKGRRVIFNFTPGLTSLNLQFMCEHEGGLHVPSDYPGYDISIIENETLATIMPYFKYVLSALVLGLKVGAHIVAGVDSLVPDVSNSLDELIQATGLGLDAVTSLKSPDEFLTGLQATPGEPSRLRAAAYTGNPDSNILIARAWVEELLEKAGCLKPYQTFLKFGLLKTPLADGRILWLCKEHTDISLHQGVEYCINGVYRERSH